MADGSIRAGEELEPLASMAAAAGVSYAAMWKAAGILKAEGILVKRKRALLVAPVAEENESENTESAVRRARWSDCAKKIERDVLSGRYGVRTKLPTAKELAQEHNVNYRTLKKALGYLGRRGIVNEDRKLSPPAGPLPSNRIILLCHGWGSGRLDFGYLDSVFLPLLEDLARQFNVRIDICVFDAGEDGLSYARQLSGAADPFSGADDVLGYLYPVVSKFNISEELLRRLSRTPGRVAVIDGAGGLPALNPFVAKPGRKIFAMHSSVRGSQTVARFLLSHGHRKAAYFSPYHGAAWSKFRFDSLESEFRSGGSQYRLVPFVIDKSDIREFGGSGRLFGYQRFVDECATRFGKRSGDLPITYRERIGNYLRGSLMWEFLYTEVACALEPLFCRALADTSITAWIASHDETAVMMLDFLKKRKVAVPEQLSVISFDNFNAAAHRRLTSYDFNLRGVLHAALTFLVHSGDFAELRKKSIVELPGVLIERESVRAVSG